MLRYLIISLFFGLLVATAYSNYLTYPDVRQTSPCHIEKSNYFEENLQSSKRFTKHKVNNRERMSSSEKRWNPCGRQKPVYKSRNKLPDIFHNKVKLCGKFNAH